MMAWLATNYLANSAAQLISLSLPTAIITQAEHHHHAWCAGLLYRVSENLLPTLIAPHFAPNQNIEFGSFALSRGRSAVLLHMHIGISVRFLYALFSMLKTGKIRNL